MAPNPLYLATAVEAALAAGRIQRRYFRHAPLIEKKGPIDLVTAADLEVEREFRKLIASRFPSHVVLGEEAPAGADDDKASCRWIIDPVDGTTNFAHGLALFCVSIGLEVDGQLEVGVVYDPMADELFTAERGCGARLNGVPLRVSNTSQLVDSLLCTGFPYSVHGGKAEQVSVFTAFLGRARGIRRLGSAALDLCYVGAGRFEGFWEEHLHPWDMAGAMLVVTEAGGLVTDYAGTVSTKPGGQVVASNGAVHAVMLDCIRGARELSRGH